MQFIALCWMKIKRFLKRYDMIIMGAIIGSFFTIIVGIFVNYKIQKSITDRAHRFEIRRLDLKMRATVFVNVLDLVKQQMFQLDRFTWAYTVKRITHKQLNKYWVGYVDSLRLWDIEYHKYKTQLTIYYSPRLANEFSSVHRSFQKTRIQVRRLWGKCATTECSPVEKARSIQKGGRASIGSKMQQTIDRCLQKKVVTVIRNNQKDTMGTYIQCIVADARNMTIRFSTELVQAHIRKQNR